jgi:hypothetical protein
MNIAPAQRLVSYLREFPLARPASPPEAARAQPAPPSASAEPPAVVERRQPLAQPAAASPPPSPRLPRGTLLNIVT